MESSNRNVWIVVAVIAVVACICVVAAALAAVGWFASRPFVWGEVTSYEGERIEQAYQVGDAPSLEIDNFAGNVTVRAGESGVIRVVATKKVTRRSDLARIEVQIDERDGGLAIRTRRPSGFRNVSVELEITTPASTRLDLRDGAGNVSVQGLSGSLEVDTGAGNVDMDDVTGVIDAHTGAGNINVRGGAGTVRLDTGAGNIRYEGTPQGDCRFGTGAGNITLVLPADVNVKVNLDTGIGNIDVDFAVDGRVTRQEVEGTIGSGAQGTITASTGTGNIDVRRR